MTLPTITLRTPADLLAATPYLLGFHPARSVVLVGLRDRQIAFAVRCDTPHAGTPPEPAAQDLLGIAARQGVDTVAVIGYGPADEVDPLVRAVDDTAGRRHLAVREALRVDGGRWWSYLCEDPRCCPPQGTPVDHAASEVAARLTSEGLAVAASRGELAQRLAALEGPARTSMDQATGRARRRLARLLASLPEEEWAGAVRTEGTVAVQAAAAAYRDGRSLDDDQAAWLSLLLDAVEVRDAAWQTATAAEPDLRLWTDLTRRADPSLAAAPASLLAVTAWRAGDGVLTGLALERALAADPSYSLAQLLLEGLRRGAAPTALDGWGTSDPPEPAETGTRAGSFRPPRPGPTSSHLLIVPPDRRR